MTQPDLFLGTWQLVPELSSYESGTPPSTGRYSIVESAPGIVAVHVQWQSEPGGPVRETGFGGPLDGTPQALPRTATTAASAPDAFTLTRIDSRTLDSAALADGAVLSWARRVASEDGALLAVVQEQADGSGRRTRNFQLYRRVMTGGADAMRDDVT